MIAASTVLDGKGGVLHDTRIVIEGSKIVAIDPKAGPVDYDLRGLTVLPGWIDAHVHITWSFGKDGKNAGTEGTTQEDAYQSGVERMGNADGGIHHRPKRRLAHRHSLARCHRERHTPRPAHPDGCPSRSKGEANRLGHRMKSARTCGNKRQAGADLIKIFASKQHPPGRRNNAFTGAIELRPAMKPGSRACVRWCTLTAMLCAPQLWQDAQKSSTARWRPTMT